MAKIVKAPSRLRDILYLDNEESVVKMPTKGMKVGDQSVTMKEHTAYIKAVGVVENRQYVAKRGESSGRSRIYVCCNSEIAKTDKEKETENRSNKRRKVGASDGDSTMSMGEATTDDNTTDACYQ